MKILTGLKGISGFMRHNKRRSFLAILGVALGVFSLVVTAGISGAMSQTLLKELGKMGDSLIVVTSSEVRKMGGRTAQLDSYTTLLPQDAIFIAEKLPHILFIAPYKEVSASISTKTTTFSAKTKGVTPDYAKALNLSTRCGRFINDSDNEDMTQVVVIGSTIAKDYFGNDCPLGEYLYLFGRAPYKIVGVLEEKGGSNAGDDQDKMVLVPLSSAMTRLTNVSYLDGFLILPSTKEYPIEQISAALEKRHGKKDFSVLRYEELAATSKQASEIFGKLTLITATISFSIGALGILAIMILSIYERVVEIGLRRTFGATKRDIFIQFMSEALFLALTGALLGTGCALGVVIGVEKIAGFVLYFPWETIAVASWLSIIIGICSGIYPAMQALRVEPREILSSL